METPERRSPPVMPLQQPPENVDEMISLKVDNISYNTRFEDVRRAFSGFGNIGDIYLPRDRRTHDNLGYAFVRFMERDDALEAMREMDGQEIDGRKIRVQMARYGRGARGGSPRNRQSRRRVGMRRSRSWDRRYHARQRYARRSGERNGSGDYGRRRYQHSDADDRQVNRSRSTSLEYTRKRSPVAAGRYRNNRTEEEEDIK